MTSWRTTLLGVLTIVVAVGSAGISYLNTGTFDWPATMMGVTAGLGLIKARDNKVSSEQAGAK